VEVLRQDLADAREQLATATRELNHANDIIRLDQDYIQQ